MLINTVNSYMDNTPFESITGNVAIFRKYSGKGMTQT